VVDMSVGGCVLDVCVVSDGGCVPERVSDSGCVPEGVSDGGCDLLECRVLAMLLVNGSRVSESELTSEL